MMTLTENQIRQLHSNGVYTAAPDHPVFTLAVLQEGTRAAEILAVIRTVSGSPNDTVAASYFMRRYGMFTAMQLWQLISYEEWWDGGPEELLFGAADEFGMRTISTYPNPNTWVEAEIGQAGGNVRSLLGQIQTVIGGLRSAAPISESVLWENVFGFWLWQFHVMLQQPDTAEAAGLVLALLKDKASWEGTADRSRFAGYLDGSEPSQLLNTTVRKTCCLSKDVPGLMQCGFCPLKK